VGSVIMVRLSSACGYPLRLASPEHVGCSNIALSPDMKEGSSRLRRACRKLLAGAGMLSGS